MIVMRRDPEESDSVRGRRAAFRQRRGTTTPVMIGAILFAVILAGCESSTSPEASTSTAPVAATTTSTTVSASRPSASDAATDPGDLYAYEVGSGKITRLTDDPRIDGAPAWMPDGRGLLFGRLVSGADPATGNSEILLITSDGLSERQLTDQPAADTTARPSAIRYCRLLFNK